MQAYLEIKHFVQGTLGCTCPEDVFNRIDYQKDCDDLQGSKIIVGDRLLIYIICLDRESDVQGIVGASLKQGVTERDMKGYSRFRLVFVASCPDEFRYLAEHAFHGSGIADDRAHFHVVSVRDIERF